MSATSQIFEAFRQAVEAMCFWGMCILALVFIAAGIGRFAKEVRRLGIVGIVAFGFLTVAAWRVSATKTNNVPPLLIHPPLSVQMVNQEGVLNQPGSMGIHLLDEPPETFPPQRIEDWWVCGAWEDSLPFSFEDGWVFPFGSNHLSSVEIDSQGGLFTDARMTNLICRLPVSLALVPNDTEVFTERTASNSYAFTWMRGHPNRLADATMDGRLELFRNGDWSVATNGVSEYHERILPFDHDGFGQDAEWVAANFTNAAEILSIGYANWVDAQVGTGLTNGLYKFTVTFTNAPPETTLLTVGDYAVAVTNAGEYVFLLKKGVEYEYDTFPSFAHAALSAVDDIPDEEISNLPLSLRSAGGVAAWTEDGGWLRISENSFSSRKRVLWMPTLRGEPNVPHLGPASFPMNFSAVLSDICDDVSVSYLWSSSDSRVQIVSSNEQSTVVGVGGMPDFGNFRLSVTSRIAGESLVSSLADATYGTNDCPSVLFSLSAPSVAFLNDDDRTTRVYRVALSMRCPVETNATASILVSGDATLGLYGDEICLDAITNLSFNLHTSPEAETDVKTLYMKGLATGSGSIEAEFIPSGGDAVSESASLRVIEPLQKLVCSTAADDGRIVNPSRLVYGTNAWLEVGANGDFSPEEVAWSVASGPGRIALVDGWRALVEPTASNGTVVVEARFGDDADIQPRFVLPVTERRNINLKIYSIQDSLGRNPKSHVNLEYAIEFARAVYEQVGISFSVEDETVEIEDFSLSELSACDVSTNATGDVVCLPGLSAEVESVCSIVESNSCFNVVCVSRILNKGMLAFSLKDRKTIFLASEEERVLAHEIGHLLGLDDIYHSLKIFGTDTTMPGVGQDVAAELFSDEPVDWAAGDGRGFCEKGDSISKTMENLLMYGKNARSNADLPHGDFLGYPRKPRHSFDTRFRHVGAKTIEGRTQ